MNTILLIAKWLHPLYKLAEHIAWVHSLTELEKLDDLLESITVSTEMIELKFK